MCLRCVELLVTLSCDKDIWRKRYSSTYYRPTNAIVLAIKKLEECRASDLKTAGILAIQSQCQILLQLGYIHLTGATDIYATGSLFRFFALLQEAYRSSVC